MTDPGYYDQSVPPALLFGGRRGGAVRAASPAPAVTAQVAPAARDQQPSPLLVTAGDPGQYSPAPKAADRPRNVTELNSAGAIPDPSTPWTVGQYVPVGVSGKRAHWNGEEWRGGESPGYPATVTNEGPAADMATGRHAADDSQAGAARADNDVQQERPSTLESSESMGLPPAPYRTQFPGDEQPGDLTR